MSFKHFARMIWLPLTVVALASLALFFSKDEPSPVTQSEAGCYVGSSTFSDVHVQITRDGRFISSGVDLLVKVYEDKIGRSFETSRRLLLDEKGHALKLAAGYPDLFRINDDGSFYVPSTDNSLILFSRCPR